MYIRRFVYILVLQLALLAFCPVFKEGAVFIDSKFGVTEFIMTGLESMAASDEQENYFVTVEEWRESGITYKIVYASDTKVMYLIMRGAYKYSVTALYNEDGSIRIYE